jgi:hypothetical protein
VATHPGPRRHRGHALSSCRHRGRSLSLPLSRIWATLARHLGSGTPRGQRGWRCCNFQACLRPRMVHCGHMLGFARIYWCRGLCSARWPVVHGVQRCRRKPPMTEMLSNAISLLGGVVPASPVSPAAIGGSLGENLIMACLMRRR